MGHRVRRRPGLPVGPTTRRRRRGRCQRAPDTVGACAVLGSSRSQKNDPNDALSTAVAALRNRRLHAGVADDHVVVMRLLADRHHDLTRHRTQAVCRLHAMLASVRPVDGAVAERKRLARELLADDRRLDSNIHATRVRIAEAVELSQTHLTDISA